MRRIDGSVRLLAAMCLAAFAFGPAIAQDEDYDALPEWYAGPFGGIVLGDSARNTDQGLNAGVIAGAAVGEALAFELTAFGSELPSSVAGVEDTTLAGGSLGLTLGTPAPGNPFFLVAGGAVSQEIATVKKTSTYGELGLGVYLPFSAAGELWRLEGRYALVSNDHPSAPAEELFEDGRVNLGVLFAFGRQPVEQVPLEEPELAPDADADGVPDAQDKCADTPRWVRPDANGCAPDSDGDGVDEARDSCPDTAAGTPVDQNGCPVTAAPAAAAGILPAEGAGDEDRDGVSDAQDACPNTTPRLDIDEKGCLKPETVSLRNVHFDLDSARLTGDGYVLLRQVGAALKADPAMRLEISGHADATGGDRYNTRLAKQRADVVRDFLHYMGIEDARLQIRSYGESKPLRENTSPEGRAMNRRVEFQRLQ